MQAKAAVKVLIPGDSSSYIIDDEKLRVPDFKGMTYKQISENQEYNDNFLFYVSYEYNADIQEGYVISYEPQKDMVVEREQQFTLL